ncbi:MAG: histidine phosphatase family protein [Bacteroidia bacterium]|nr:histidine phosphatase family protein [Bacteroidia bacterium]
MKKTLLLLALLFGSLSLMAQDIEAEATVEEEITLPKTTYYLIRHAEKDRSNVSDKNPHLTQQGLLRAAKWSYVLGAVKFEAVYSTDYNRTRETALPTAEKNGIAELNIYNPSNMDMKGFVEGTSGKTVLVVGHSNTTPKLVNTLIGSDKYEQIDDSNNANLYIVTVLPSGEKTDVLLVID